MSTRKMTLVREDWGGENQYALRAKPGKELRTGGSLSPGNVFRCFATSEFESLFSDLKLAPGEAWDVLVAIEPDWEDE